IGRFLDEVETSDHATQAQRTFVREFKDFIARREQDGAEIVAAEKAGKLLAEAKALDAYEAAALPVLEKFRRVAARKGLYQARARKGADEIQRELRTLHLQVAENAVRSLEALVSTDPDARRPGSEIAAALEAASRAVERARATLDAAAIGDFEKRRDAIATEQKSRAAYADGRSNHEAGRDAAALAALQSVDPASTLAPKAAAIRDAILQKRSGTLARTRAAALFMDGKGEEALETLRAASISDPAMEGRVRRIQAATAEAEQAEKDADFPKARAAWARVVEAAMDPGNAYNREAKRRIAAISPGIIAGGHYEKGKAASDAGKWREAREWFAKAREANPDTTLGRTEIEKMQKEARTLLNKAALLKAEKPDEARSLYLQILEMVEEDDPLAETAHKRIQELDGGGAAP
ncbi:MAG: hypothetical protein AAB215_09960, partial [Planctomycetota bacterium]